MDGEAAISRDECLKRLVSVRTCRRLYDVVNVLSAVRLLVVTKDANNGHPVYIWKGPKLAREFFEHVANGTCLMLHCLYRCFKGVQRLAQNYFMIRNGVHSP